MLSLVMAFGSSFIHQQHLFLIIVVIYCSIYEGYCQNNKCGKLEFYSETYKCLSCSICSPGSSSFRSECRNNNPNPLRQGEYLWCDSLEGPFPKCHGLDDSIIVNCSKAPEFRFRFGDTCEIDCAGVKKVIACTEELIWNDTISDCTVITTTTHTISTTGRAADTSTCVDVNIFVIAGSCVGVGVFLIVLMLLITVYHKRKHQNTQPRVSSSQDSQSTSQDSYEIDSEVSSLRPHDNRPKSQNALHIPKEHKFECIPTEKIALFRTPFQEPGIQTPVAEDSVSRGFPEVPETRNPSLLTKTESEVGHFFSNVPLLSSLDNSEHCQNGQREIQVAQPYSNSTSIDALRALLNNQNKTKELCQMMDQEDKFGRLNWKPVAYHLLGWSIPEIDSFEYKNRPALGESLTYHMLNICFQKGLGLLEVINCMKSYGYKEPLPVKFLETFWSDWEQKEQLKRY